MRETNASFLLSFGVSVVLSYFSRPPPRFFSFLPPRFYVFSRRGAEPLPGHGPDAIARRFVFQTKRAAKSKRKMNRRIETRTVETRIPLELGKKERKYQANEMVKTFAAFFQGSNSASGKRITNGQDHETNDYQRRSFSTRRIHPPRLLSSDHPPLLFLSKSTKRRDRSSPNSTPHPYHPATATLIYFMRSVRAPIRAADTAIFHLSTPFHPSSVPRDVLSLVHDPILLPSPRLVSNYTRINTLLKQSVIRRGE